MKTFEFEYYSVDECDGGGMRSTPFAFFTNYADAALLAKQLGPYYSANSTLVRKRFTIMESVDEYQAYHLDKMRQAALNKLTMEERKLLGLE